MITVQPPISDADRALLEQVLDAVHLGRPWDRAAAIYIVHMGDPIPKARARVTDFGNYTPKRTVVAQRNLSTVLAESVPVRPFYSNVAIGMVFFLPDRRRCDRDNLEKLVMDAGTKAELWQDDSQNTRGLSLVEQDAHHPRTLIALCPTTSTLDRTVPMKQRRGLALPLQRIHIASPRKDPSHV